MKFSNFTLTPNGLLELVRRKRSAPIGVPIGPPVQPPPVQQSSYVAEEMDFLRIFMALNEEERILIGHNFTSFIKACTFRGNDCLKEK